MNEPLIRRTLRLIGAENLSLIIALMILVALIVSQTEFFFSARNLFNIGQNMAVVGLIAVGMTMVIVSGRQWLLQGDCVDGDTYLGQQARGWDECFPTVGVCQHPAWGGPMRDHGELWGREWAVTQGQDTCTATCDDHRFHFTRSLHLDGASVIAEYHLTNRSPKALPYLWSQHALLATTHADRIVFQGVTDLCAKGQPVDWPNHPARDLSTVGTIDEGIAMKLYGDAQETASAEVTAPSGGIRFDWSGADVPAFGLWLDYGGWPPQAPVHQVALEPTTAPADDLVAAEAMGRARVLNPGEAHRWSFRITLTPKHQRQH